MFTEFRRGISSDNLVNGVFDNRYGDSGGNVFHGNTIFLRLLDGRVHKYRTSGAQIHGRIAFKTESRKFFGIIAHRFGKGLYKRTAARGTCLV